MDHSEILGDARGQKSKNRHTAAFLKKVIVFSKTAHLCENKLFFTIFCCFRDFAKKPLRGYFFKFCQNVPENNIYCIESFFHP